MWQQTLGAEMGATAGLAFGSLPLAVWSKQQFRSLPQEPCWDQFGECQRGFSRSSEASTESRRCSFRGAFWAVHTSRLLYEGPARQEERAEVTAPQGELPGSRAPLPVGGHLQWSACGRQGSGRRQRRPGRRWCQLPAGPPLCSAVQCCLPGPGRPWVAALPASTQLVARRSSRVLRAGRQPGALLTPRVDQKVKTTPLQGLQQPCKAAGSEEPTSPASTGKRAARLLGGAGTADCVWWRQGRAPVWLHPFPRQVRPAAAAAAAAARGMPPAARPRRPAPRLFCKRTRSSTLGREEPARCRTLPEPGLLSLLGSCAAPVLPLNAARSTRCRPGRTPFRFSVWVQRMRRAAPPSSAHPPPPAAVAAAAAACSPARGLPRPDDVHFAPCKPCPRQSSPPPIRVVPSPLQLCPPALAGAAAAPPPAVRNPRRRRRASLSVPRHVAPTCCSTELQVPRGVIMQGGKKKTASKGELEGGRTRGDGRPCDLRRSQRALAGPVTLGCLDLFEKGWKLPDFCFYGSGLSHALVIEEKIC